MASKDSTGCKFIIEFKFIMVLVELKGRSLQNLCGATFFESQPSARWTKGLRKATFGSLTKSNNQPTNRYFVDCGHIVCPPNIWDSPLHPPSSVSKEPEQKGAPPIERFHHPGTERVTSAERNKDREPITHLPPIVARLPGTGHFLRRNKDLPRPCLAPQLTSCSNGLGNLTIPEYAFGNSQVEFFSRE